MSVRVPLAHLPTPLERCSLLDELVGAQVWLKRDDMTGGADAGNKLRKLEFLLAEAESHTSNVVITCGGEQSNHARATALSARRLGMQAVLLLRTEDPRVEPALTGNLFLDRLAGADVRFISPSEYRDRDHLMARAAAELTRRGHHPYVIPEGGSDGLGSLGYVRCAAEIRQQMEAEGLPPFDLVAHACGSGGTAAGLLLGLRRFDVSRRLCSVAVCDNRAYFEERIATIVAQARTNLGASHELRKAVGAPPPNPGFADATLDSELYVQDEFRGPGYAQASGEQVLFLREAATRAGLVLDPVYSGKALFGLSRLPKTFKGERVLFIHTGGLPGLLAQADSLKFG